jgi:hypothetical protein
VQVEIWESLMRDSMMNEEWARFTLLANVASTLLMVGLIWFVQIVHYPLFADVSEPSFSKYEQRHNSLTTWVVAPPMLVELITATMLLWFCPAGVSRSTVGVGFMLVAVIWISTALLQVPCHDALVKGFQVFVHQRLVATNWVRTVAWSLRGCLVLSMIWSKLKT